MLRLPPQRVQWIYLWLGPYDEGNTKQYARGTLTRVWMQILIIPCVNIAMRVTADHALGDSFHC